MTEVVAQDLFYRNWLSVAQWRSSRQWTDLQATIHLHVFTATNSLHATQRVNLLLERFGALTVELVSHYKVVGVLQPFWPRQGKLVSSCLCLVRRTAPQLSLRWIASVSFASVGWPVQFGVGYHPVGQQHGQPWKDPAPRRSLINPMLNLALALCFGCSARCDYHGILKLLSDGWINSANADLSVSRVCACARLQILSFFFWFAVPVPVLRTLVTALSSPEQSKMQRDISLHH